MIHRIGITTGDPDGIGFEVSAKALEKIGPQRSARFYVWRNDRVDSALLKRLHKKFRVKTVPSWPEALKIPLGDKKTLIEIVNNTSPAHWVETAAQACVSGAMSAMATAPLSKQAIYSAGLKDIGHTDILKRISGHSTACMGFIGKRFNVVLATGHVPVSKITKALTHEAFMNSFKAAEQLRSLLGPQFRRRPIGLLGLNPHAGDSGLIGSEELDLFKNVLRDAKKLGYSIEGPLVPDAAFHKSQWKRFSVYVACYHDQGLIPFKAIHGHESGAHLTLGLPLKRTSVDHGTAKDIFGKNLADPRSMISAIKWAQKWTMVVDNKT